MLKASALVLHKISDLFGDLSCEIKDLKIMVLELKSP